MAAALDSMGPPSVGRPDLDAAPTGDFHVVTDDERALRVLEVTQRFAPALGGVEIYAARLIRELRRGGLEVEVATTDLLRDEPFRRLDTAAPPDEFPVRRHRAIRFARLPHGLGIAAPGMMRAALTTTADVVHAHAFGYSSTWAGALERVLRRRPLVITPHSDPGRGTTASRLYARAMAAATLRRADRVHALTPRERELLLDLGVNPDRIRVVPNAIDLAEFDHPRLNPSTPRPSILFVGRLYARQKGLVPLVRAFASLGASPRPFLRLAGEDWGGWIGVQKLAVELGVADRLLATGPLPRIDLVREYLSTDLFVLPSLFESSPTVILEAMAAGLPIVATRVGGVADILSHGKTALLVPPNDAPALAAAIDQLLSDPSLAETLGRAAKSAVAAYSWDRIAPQYLAMFRELAG